MSKPQVPPEPANRGKLRFRFDEILDEIGGFMVTSTPYFTKIGTNVLSQLRESLQSVRASNPGELQWWGIKDKLPLETIPSVGQYERSRTTTDIIFARITSKWGVTVVPQGHGVRPKELFEICSSASVVVEVLDSKNLNEHGKPNLIWCWRFEVGDPAHPGCFFHTQLGSNVQPVASGTQDISIPRLPALAITPISAADFVLGELFQTEWAETAGRDTEDVNRWSKVHTKILSTLLEWKLNRVKQRGAIGSPWLWLKNHRPLSDMFAKQNR